MEDNNINDFLERNGAERRVPFLRSSRDREFMDDQSDTSSKHRYTSSRKTVNKTVYETSIPSEGGYNLRGGSSRSSRGRSESPVDIEHKRSYRLEQRRSKHHMVINGASATTDASTSDVIRHHFRSKSSRSANTSDYSSDEGKETETLKGTAFPLYKQAGDWWDVFPKTDYTYSPASSHRKEIVPGIIPMPNMSRRSIHSDSSATDLTSRYSFSSNSGDAVWRRRHLLDADSDVDEVDSHYSKRSEVKSSYLSTLMRIFLSIWTFLVNITSSVSQTVRRVFRRDGSQHAYRRTAKELHHHSWHQQFRNWSVEKYLRMEYWIRNLFSRQDIRTHDLRNENERPCGWKFFLLLLIPLLILAAWWWLSSLDKDPGNTVVTLVDSASSKAIWWLPFASLWASESIIISPTEDTSTGSEYAVNVDLLVQKIVGNKDFQNLVLLEAIKRDQERRKSEEEILSTLQSQKETLERELNDKNEMLNQQQLLHAKLAEDVVSLKQQVDSLEVQLMSVSDTENAPIIDPTQGLWRREIRRLEDRIKLLEVSYGKRPCCKVTPQPLPLLAIEEHVMRFLTGLFNSDGEAESKIPGIQTWLERLFVAKEDLESKLANISSTINVEVGEASRRSAQAIMGMVSDKIKHEYVKQQAEISAKMSEEKRNWVLPVATLADNCSLTVSQVQDIVNNALNTYDADKTGMVDYALESSGGSIINTRCTDTYNARTATLSLLGVPLWWPSSNPRTVIQPGVNPGECWAFRGAQGYLVIRLSGRVKISAFSIEHIPVSLAPNGRIDSAPKDFSVWGLKNENDKDPEMLGRYTYRDNATSLQFFNVQRTDLPPYEIVELRIESNHGNLEYTCLYRFRVHGVLSRE